MIYKSLYPLTQSMDLVEGDAQAVSQAVLSEIKRYCPNENGIILKTTPPFSPGLFLSECGFLTNVPTVLWVIPAVKGWSIILTNTFICSGYDSLCHNLTRLYGWPTFHFQSSDSTTTMLPGTGFTYRFLENEEMRKRYAQASVDDSDHWVFYENGPVQPFERVENYKERIKKKRLNEARMKEIFQRLGLDPWNDASYLVDQPCSLVRRTQFPDIVNSKDMTVFLARFQGARP